MAQTPKDDKDVKVVLVAPDAKKTRLITYASYAAEYLTRGYTVAEDHEQRRLQEREANVRKRQQALGAGAEAVAKV